jgi:two-component system cell cycle sensor histidine kinase/response regulator CckA
MTLYLVGLIWEGVAGSSRYHLPGDNPPGRFCMDEVAGAPQPDLEHLASFPFDVLESISDALFILDAEWRFTYVNARAELLLRRTHSELLGKHLLQECPGVVDRMFDQAYRSALARREPVTFETYAAPLAAWLFVRASPLQSGICVLLQDITERKAAEAERQELASIVNSSFNAVLGKTLEGVITSWNPSAVRLYGYTREEAVGQHISLIIPPERAHELSSIMERLRRGERIEAFETVRRHKDGSLINVSVTISPIRNSLGEIVGASTIAHDITERKLLAEQLLHAQKMEGIGRLAGGIAHDFNNLLAAIMGYAELAEMEAPGGEQFREYLANVTKAAERAATLTGQLLAFARKQVTEPKVIDLNELLVDIEKLLRRLIGEDILFQVATWENPVIVRVDPSQLAQVLINLAVNARDAMPEGGELTMDVSICTIPGNAPLLQPSLLRPDLPVGQYALLRVHDTGLGMSAEVKAHLFEPFFTTKGPGKGTGLGLATSYGIIKQSHGDIVVESEPGQGTTFSIYLPISDEVAAPLPALRTLARMPMGTETVLFVEDEPLVRGFAVQILRSLNYSVLEAADGREALEIVAGLGEADRIDLLMTDVIMPRVGGHELAQRLLTERPDLRVLYCSGYTDDEIIKKGVLEEGADFLQKPYAPSALALKVRQVLDRATTSLQNEAV